MAAAEFHTRHELAHRTNAGIHVSLFWPTVGETLVVEVHDTCSDELFELEVPRERALDAFRHPYAYLAAADARARREHLQVA